MAAIDITIALQIATLFIAGVGPFLAYRHARKLFVSEGRQAWINDLRTDLAELISTCDIAVTVYQDNTVPNQLELYRTAMHTVQTLRMRIRLRLEGGNPRHDRLIAAIESLLVAYDKTPEERDQLRSELLDASEKTLQHVWRRLERGH